jgi:hypothetical protein
MCGRKIMVENVRQKNHSRKSAAEKSQQKHRGRKSAE